MIGIKALAVAVSITLAPQAPAVHQAPSWSFTRERAYAEQVSHANRHNLRCLVLLWERESGWNPWAVNPYSGAYGIPQANPAAQGYPYQLGHWRDQIRWGLSYIHRRYGHSCQAWWHELSTGWY